MAAVQVGPHSMPGGCERTVPEPVPRRTTVSTGFFAKLATTVLSAFIVTTQLVVPVRHPPPQPTKYESECGVAVTVTALPGGNSAEHVPGQSTPAGAVRIVPVPDPAD